MLCPSEPRPSLPYRNIFTTNLCVYKLKGGTKYKITQTRGWCNVYKLESGIKVLSYTKPEGGVSHMQTQIITCKINIYNSYTKR